ncbi:MAG: nucleoside hydrolase [Planctomycetota bacterium]|jgi:inosine-uridine nucleoside N-ribohydrolase
MPLHMIIVAALLLGAVAEPGPQSAREKTPVIVDTDVGTDVDDAFALALALASPELDVRGITTVSADAYTRALIACRLLDAVGRPGIPVAAGRPRREKPALEGQYQYGLRPARKRPLSESAVEFLYRELEARPGEITLIALGDLTNVAELIRKHPEAKPWIKRIVLMGGSLRVGFDGQPPPVREWNVRADVSAAQTVFNSGLPLVVAPVDATTHVKLVEPLRRRVFRTDTPLCRHLEALYDLWGKETPTLFDPVAVALVLDESFCTMEDLRIEVDDRGFTRVREGAANCRAATSIRSEAFLGWYVRRVTRPVLVARDLPDELVVDVVSEDEIRVLGYPLGAAGIDRLLGQIAAEPRRPRSALIGADRNVTTGRVQRIVQDCQQAGIEELQLRVARDGPRNVSRPVPQGNMPTRVHVAENYETDIERRWWLAGRPTTQEVPSGSTRACRAVLCRDFDGRMGDRQKIYRAVVFNPVPGPPMGPRTRLSFRYRLAGSDALRVQIYSLSNNYHRRLTLTGLPQKEWQTATVDMTEARRPDGSGGPLSEGERIDDVQFYVDPGADLVIDDVVLYEAASPAQKHPFPKRIIFTGWFDTGKHPQHWPGDLEIVPYGEGTSSRAARSVAKGETDSPWLRVHLRGRRPLGPRPRLRFRYRLTGGDKLHLTLADGAGGDSLECDLTDVVRDRWAETDAGFVVPEAGDGKIPMIDQIRFVIDPGAELLVDDLVLYEPADAG